MELSWVTHYPGGGGGGAAAFIRDCGHHAWTSVASVCLPAHQLTMLQPLLCLLLASAVLLCDSAPKPTVSVGVLVCPLMSVYITTRLRSIYPLVLLSLQDSHESCHIPPGVEVVKLWSDGYSACNSFSLAHTSTHQHTRYLVCVCFSTCWFFFFYTERKTQQPSQMFHYRYFRFGWLSGSFCI